MRFVHTCTCTKIKDSERFKNIQQDYHILHVPAPIWSLACCRHVRNIVWGLRMLHIHQNQRFKKIRYHIIRLHQPFWNMFSDNTASHPIPSGPTQILIPCASSCYAPSSLFLQTSQVHSWICGACVTRSDSTRREIWCRMTLQRLQIFPWLRFEQRIFRMSSMFYWCFHRCWSGKDRCFTGSERQD